MFQTVNNAILESRARALLMAHQYLSEGLPTWTFEDNRGHAYVTTRETATNCAAAAATTSRWKISWKPSVRGNGFGHLAA